MKTITLILFLVIAGCSSARETPCVEYAAQAALRGLEMCYTQVKENADEAQTRRPQRTETDVSKDER